MGRENQKVKSTLQRVAELQKGLDAAEEIKVVAEAPTAVEADRGKIIVVAGATGAADTVNICVKGTDDKYSYKAVTIS